MGDSFKEELGKLASNLLSAFLIFLLIIFIFGQLYGMYAARTGNAFIMWLPVLALVAILFYKILE
jgi:hypothetical protein